MHDIEPYYHWRDKYVASEDKLSPYFNKNNDDFVYSNKVYNYFIHPEWDEIGSSTLYAKVLYVHYSQGVAVIELIGEWNDCLQNDIMFLKRNLIDTLLENNIFKYILICENVLNFHGSDNCYYEEWHEEIVEQDGWICILNTLNHVVDEMNNTELNYYVHYGDIFAEIPWRSLLPKNLLILVERLLFRNLIS